MEPLVRLLCCEQHKRSTMLIVENRRFIRGEPTRFLRNGMSQNLGSTLECCCYGAVGIAEPCTCCAAAWWSEAASRQTRNICEQTVLFTILMGKQYRNSVYIESQLQVGAAGYAHAAKSTSPSQQNNASLPCLSLHHMHL